MSASSHNLSPRLWTPKPSPPRKVFLSAACVSPSREAAVEGRLPRGIGIERLRDPPTEWSAQFEALGLNPKQPQPRPASPELLWRNARNTALDHRHRETDFLDAETKRCGLRRLDGGRTRARTWDPMIKSNLLYNNVA